jgi:ribosomal protein S1
VLKANVLTIEKERSRLTLTLKNLANPNWEDFFETTKIGDKVKGKIKSIKRFGAFVEIAPNVVGFLKSNEISWTMRDVDINNLFSVGQEIETEIHEIDKAKEQINLSYRRLQPNNWKEIADKYEKNLEYSAVVKFIPPNDSGAVVSLNNEIDGFMPAQKMKALYTGKKPNFKAGDVVQVKIMEKDYEKYSLLFESAIKPENPFVSAEGNDFSNNRNRNAVATAETKGTNNYTFADLLSESSKNNLLK